MRELQAEQSPAQLDRSLARYLKPDLLLIDDMGLKILPPKSGEILLEIILRRYENRSTLMTSNPPLFLPLGNVASSWLMNASNSSPVMPSDVAREI